MKKNELNGIDEIDDIKLIDLALCCSVVIIALTIGCYAVYRVLYFIFSVC